MKGRKSRATGGKAEFEEDLKSKPNRRDNAPKIENAAEERKRGGKVKKDCGDVEGGKSMPNFGRKPRKSGGRTGSDKSPFSSARHGTMPSGHKPKAID